MADGICFGDMLWMKSTWNPDNISVSLVGLDHDGSYYDLMDVTDEFIAIF